MEPFSPPTQHPTHCSLRRAPEGGRLPAGIASHKIAKALANGERGWGKLAHSRTLSGRSAGQPRRAARVDVHSSMPWRAGGEQACVNGVMKTAGVRRCSTLPRTP